MTSRFASAVVLLCVIGGSRSPSAQGAAARPAPALKAVMDEKIAAAEQLLRPIVAADFVAIARQTDRLRHLSRAAMASWQPNPDDRYLQQATALVQSIQEMREAARLRDAERASIGYAAMLSACVQCHQLRRARPSTSIPHH